MMPNSFLASLRHCPRSWDDRGEFVRVLLISANTETMSMPTLPLGLACVAAATRNAGNEVALLNLMFEGDPMLGIRNSIEDFRPDVIGISVRNIDDQNMPQPSVPACSGQGGHSELPKLVRCSDYPWRGWLQHLPRERVALSGRRHGNSRRRRGCFPPRRGSNRQGRASFGYSRDLPARPGPLEGRSFEKNLDDLPLPEPNLWIPPGADNRNLWVPVQSRRGCPLDCTFCSTSAIEGEAVRSTFARPNREVAGGTEGDWMPKLQLRR